MMQKTDFEFELVIGEDCSQDKTRDICFEYQKKYPDKIRVLWWHENVSKLGGNSRRVRAHCRGEFIAFCEGDDYWIDPLKLQKQVDVMRKFPNVGMSFCGAERYLQVEGKFEDWPVDFHPGVLSNLHFYSMMVDIDWWPRRTVATASVVVRRELLCRICEKYDIFKWKLHLGDVTIWIGMSMESDVHFLSDVVSVYRINPSSVCGRCVSLVNRDVYIVKEYYIFKRYGVDLRKIPREILYSQLWQIIYADKRYPFTKRSFIAREIFLPLGLLNLLFSPFVIVASILYVIGVANSFFRRIEFSFLRRAICRNSIIFKL
jgi:glycosyltransferase involved in cell wall biosynthesis